jgi:aspartate racemase
MSGVPLRKLIGVLGGMGPAATANFLARIAELTPASRDQDHVPLIVHAVPQIPDRSAAILADDDAPFLPLASGIRFLENAGAEAIVMPCNTAHHWHRRLSRLSRVPILHIADAVVEDLGPEGADASLAILATRGTLASSIYEERLRRTVGRVVIPDEEIQILVDQAIATVKAGRLAEASGLAEEIAALSLTAGANRLLLACTELPIAFARLASSAPVLDATDALARACIRRSMPSLPAAALKEAV